MFLFSDINDFIISLFYLFNLKILCGSDELVVLSVLSSCVGMWGVYSCLCSFIKCNSYQQWPPLTRPHPSSPPRSIRPLLSLRWRTSALTLVNLLCLGLTATKCHRAAQRSLMKKICTWLHDGGVDEGGGVDNTRMSVTLKHQKHQRRFTTTPLMHHGRCRRRTRERGRDRKAAERGEREEVVRCSPLPQWQMLEEE